jgi:hypothetical protein
MPFGYIYKIVFPNGKHYIGLTTISLEQRTKEHKRCSKSGGTNCLYKALRKYNMVDTFELIEIDNADTLEELREKEIGYIEVYNSHYIDGNGYNMTLGGEGTIGYVHTEYENQKNSERQKKYFENNPEAGKEHSERMKKYYQENPEARKEQSERVKKYYEENLEAGNEHGERMIKYYEENPDARQKQSENTKKRFETPEAREQMSEIKKIYYENPEARQQISEGLKRYYEENPDAIQKNSVAHKKYYEENPEARQKQSETRKKYYEENLEARRKVLDTRGQNKPFDVFTSEGTFIKTFTYQYEAKEYLQKEHHITCSILICQVLAGKQKTSAGFIFKYK